MDGAALKSLIQQAGVSQRRLAHRLGLRPQTLSRRLAGPVPPELTARVLAAILADLRARQDAAGRRSRTLGHQLEALLDRGDARPLVPPRARRPRA
ncbi:MAG TPA: helix-turn-helix transcriptional regulator [Dehalococcoidia bacterium]